MPRTFLLLVFGVFGLLVAVFQQLKCGISCRLPLIHLTILKQTMICSHQIRMKTSIGSKAQKTWMDKVSNKGKVQLD